MKNLEFLQILTSKHEILNYTTLTTVYDEIYIKNSYFYRDLALQIPFEFEPLYADILATVTYLDYELVVNTPYQSGKKCKSYISNESLRFVFLHIRTQAIDCNYWPFKYSDVFACLKKCQAKSLYNFKLYYFHPFYNSIDEKIAESIKATNF